MLDCSTKHYMLGQALPPQQTLLPTAALLPGGEDNSDIKSTSGASEPPAAFACFRHLFGSRQLTNLKPGSVTGSFCQEWPNLSCWGGGGLNIKHFFVSQKSVLEGQEQPGHRPLQDPSDQPYSEENTARRRNLRREQKDVFQLETEDQQL